MARQGATATKGSGDGLVTSAWRPAAGAEASSFANGAGGDQYGGAVQPLGPSGWASGTVAARERAAGEAMSKLMTNADAKRFAEAFMEDLLRSD
jgi:hypothetical protein